VFQLQVTALDLRLDKGQIELFGERRTAYILNWTMGDINKR